MDDMEELKISCERVEGGEEVGALGGRAGDALHAQRQVGRTERAGDQQQSQQVRPRAQLPGEDKEPQQNPGTK